MPVYTMNCFKLPKGICEEINTILAKFWWSKGPCKGMSWLSWKRLSFSKKEGGLGFRDIERFNKALLGKQVWRLLTQPSSLAARLLKDRYFPKTTILQSKIGTKPSYLWRSLQVGKDLLNVGLRCVVGNGKNIQFWLDPWLNLHPPRPPRKRNDILNVNQPVADFIQHPSNIWNIRLLEDVVTPEDIEAIRKIKLNSFDCEDIIGWHYTKDGSYTMKLGYWLATQLSQDTRLPPYRSLDLKKQVWTLKTSPKIQHFLWRILSKVVPVSSILKEQNITNDSICRRCCMTDESLDHLFFTCPYAKMIWRAVGLSSRHIEDPTHTFHDKMTSLLQFANTIGNNAYQKQLPFWTLWRIWKSQNILQYQRKTITWVQTYNMINKDIMEWLAATETIPCRRFPANVTDNVRSDCHWVRPQSGFIKCNYDCSFKNNVEPAKSGWIFRNAGDEILEAGSRIGAVCNSVLEAEFQALLMTMQQAWIKGYQCVIFEGDNQTLHKVLSIELTLFGLYPWVREIQHWRCKFTDAQFQWTSGKCNIAADAIVRAHN